MKQILSFLAILLFCCSCSKNRDIYSPQEFAEKYKVEETIKKSSTPEDIEKMKKAVIDWYAKIFKIDQKTFNPADLTKLSDDEYLFWIAREIIRRGQYVNISNKDQPLNSYMSSRFKNAEEDLGSDYVMYQLTDEKFRDPNERPREIPDAEKYLNPYKIPENFYVNIDANHINSATILVHEVAHVLDIAYRIRTKTCGTNISNPLTQESVSIFFETLFALDVRGIELSFIKWRISDYYRDKFREEYIRRLPENIDPEVKKQFPAIEKASKQVDSYEKIPEFWKKFPCLLPYKKIFDDLRIEWFPETRDLIYERFPKPISEIACAPVSTVVDVISAKISKKPMPTKVYPLETIRHTARAIHLKQRIDSGKLSVVDALHELVTNPPETSEITIADLKMIFRVLEEGEQQ